MSRRTGGRAPSAPNPNFEPGAVARSRYLEEQMDHYGVAGLHALTSEELDAVIQGADEAEKAARERNHRGEPAPDARPGR